MVLMQTMQVRTWKSDCFTTSDLHHNFYMAVCIYSSALVCLCHSASTFCILNVTMANHNCGPITITAVHIDRTYSFEEVHFRLQRSINQSLWLWAEPAQGINELSGCLGPPKSSLQFILFDLILIRDYYVNGQW